MCKIKELRKQKNISQAKLAKALNVHQTAVSQWEQGKTFPDIDTLKKIAEYFGVTTDYLLGREQNNNISDNFNLTEHEKKLVSAYRRNADTQPYVDKLLGIEEDNPSIKSKFA